MTRVFVFALVLVAMLALAVPALAFNGFRSDFTLTTNCQSCHTTTPGAPIYNKWAQTKHADSNADGQATQSPTGSSCAGCHTSNYDPRKAVPTPTATAYLPEPSSATPSPVPTKTTISYDFPNAPDATNINSGNNSSSELDVGCSSCHYGQSLANANAGQDVNNTAHTAAMREMANADICGQCHSRYSYLATPLPLTSPTPGSKLWVQPQYAVGFQMLGNPTTSPVPFVAAPLSTNLIVQSPGWSPSPNPSATSAAGLMTYWKVNGTDTVWQQKGHDGSAAQYPEWQNEGHANALVDLKAAVPNSVIDGGGCLKCHSADYRNAPLADKPNAAAAKYGITCVGCHTPHDKGTVTGAWDEAFDAQLVGDTKDVCSECHTAELGGEKAVAGETIHNTMTEIMAGTGAIGVPDMPGVHEGKCIKCHMPPTSYSRGSVQLGGNHTFTIIDPEVAAEVSPIPVATTTPNPTASPVVVNGVMPFSACSTCHGKPSDPLATYLQGTIESRQVSIESKIDAIKAELAAASARLGAPIGTTDDETIDWTLNGLDPWPGHDAPWVGLNQKTSVTDSELSYQRAYTNMTIIENEGSMGVHNFQYSSAVADKALDQAAAVKATLTGITAVPSVTQLTYGGNVMITGSISGGTQEGLVGGQVKLWRQNNGSDVWNVVGTTYVDGDLSNEYDFTVSPSRSAIYKAQFLGTDTYEAIESAPTALVNVAWNVSIKVNKTKLKKGGTFTFTGTVGPTNQSSGIVVTLMKKTSSGWVPVTSSTHATVAADGSWTIKYKSTKTGKLTVNVSAAANTTHTIGTSASKTITTTK